MSMQKDSAELSLALESLVDKGAVKLAPLHIAWSWILRLLSCTTGILLKFLCTKITEICSKLFLYCAL